MSEYEIKMDEAFGLVVGIEKQCQRLRTKLADNDPFGLMVELAETQRIVRDAMKFTVEAQEEFIKPIRDEAARIS